MDRYRIPHATWTVIPKYGLAFWQGSGTSVVATHVGDGNIQLDTEGPITVRLSAGGRRPANSVLADRVRTRRAGGEPGE
jgi:hypothetical protein